MDKVITFMKAVKKYHFWILCVIIPLTSMVIWYLSTGKISQATAKQYGIIKSKRSNLQKIANELNHPNEKVHEKMDSIIGDRRNVVQSAWEIRWKQYENILTWPKRGLTEKFRNEVAKLHPFEKISPTDEESLDIGFREMYRDYIKDELPNLADVIGSHWNPTNERGESPNMERFGRNPNATMAVDPNLLVHWKAEDQARIESEHFDWSKSIDSLPTTLEVLYAQEDLWVLIALLEIIAEANHGATTNSSATVKQIEYIQIGRDAKNQLGQLTPVVSRDNQQDGGQGMLNDYDIASSRSGLDGAYRGSLDWSDAEENLDPAGMRYVNETFQPLSGAELRSAVNNATSDKLSLAVAKRMPIRLRLIVDQRRIDDLLIACGNSELIVEVRQLRFNPDASGKGGPGGGRRFMDRVENIGGNQVGTDDYDSIVEVFGIIYIYNPVDLELLGIKNNEAFASS